MPRIVVLENKSGSHLWSTEPLPVHELIDQRGIQHVPFVSVWVTQIKNTWLIPMGTSFCNSCHPSVFKELLCIMMLGAGRIPYNSQSCMDSIEASDWRLLFDKLMNCNSDWIFRQQRQYFSVISPRWNHQLLGGTANLSPFLLYLLDSTRRKQS